MIKSSSDNYSESSAECLLIDFCLYIYIYIYIWIYENGAKDLEPYHPYFPLISLNFLAASKPCKRAKIRERMAMKER